MALKFKKGRIWCEMLGWTLWVMRIPAHDYENLDQISLNYHYTKNILKLVHFDPQMTFLFE